MTVLNEIKQRRIDLGYKQKDMQARIGVSRQQYQQIESKGNPRLDTLELIAKGLNSELMLIPNEKKRQILAILNEDKTVDVDIQSLIDNPWQGLLGDDESWKLNQTQSYIHVARAAWQDKLNELPMLNNHKQLLLERWRNLASDFRI